MTEDKSRITEQGEPPILALQSFSEFNRTCFQLIIIRLTFLPNRKVFIITRRSKISGWRFGYLACLA
jgi:hypothetical protein